jgi:hypothetical protein
MTVAKSTRDLRIDLFRGLALYMIFSDHINLNIVRLFTYHRFGFSDASEIFIFLSGISCSLLYGKILSREGFAAAQRRAAYRVLQIYVGYVAVVLASFAVTAAFRNVLGWDYITENEFALLMQAPGRALLGALGLYYTPQYVDILPVYMALVAAAPLVIYGLRRHIAVTAAMSTALWAVATFSSHLEVPNLVPSGVSGYNPFSWQFLFCIGLGVGEHCYAGGRSFRPVGWVNAVCWLVVAANLLARVLYDFGRFHEPWHVEFLDAVHEASGGQIEGFFRLTHFLAVAYLVAGLVRPQAAAVQSVWLRPLVWCGQHSLEVFCLGVLLSEFGCVYFHAVQPAPIHQLAVNFAGWTAMSALALYMGVRRKRRVAASTAATVPAGVQVDAGHRRSAVA